MKTLKFLTIVGARPQFIKAAVISRIISSEYRNVEEILVHTGQHFDANMSDIFFDELEITKPKYFLNVNNTTHGDMIGQMIIKLEKILLQEDPDCILLYGDTNSTLAGGIAGKKLNIPVAHIEAGVRNFDEEMPEESNRYLVDRLADFNFCCTNLGYSNLEFEGLTSSKLNKQCYVSGDLMYDAALFEKNKDKRATPTYDQIISQRRDFVLVTIHRASNTDSKNTLNAIIDDLNLINDQIDVVLLAHPRTKKQLSKYNIFPCFKIYDPVGYHENLKLIQASQFVITDSGGVVREAYFFNKKSLFILDNPVWPELIQANLCMNIGPIQGEIRKAFNALIDSQAKWENNIFGDGEAGKFILSTLISTLR